MTKAIVTGGAGFIGSHVARICADYGWRVMIIDDFSGGFMRNVPDRADVYKGSITDERTEKFIAGYEADVVFHLAAYAAEGLSHHIPAFNYLNNLVGTSRVLNGAFRGGARHFVFTSSIAAYGHPKSDGSPFCESDPLIPIDPYGVAKKACEEHIRVFHEMHKRGTYSIFRPHNVFGPNQNVSDPYRNVVGIFMRQCIEGEQMSIFGDGEQTRSFSYVDVVARAIVDSYTNPESWFKTFNIGGDQPMSVNELATEIAQRFFKSNVNVKHLPPRHEAKHAHCDHTEARKIFKGIYEKYDVPIGDGLTRMAEWVRSTGIPKPTKCPSTIEIEHNLPPSWKVS